MNISLIVTLLIFLYAFGITVIIGSAAVMR